MTTRMLGQALAALVLMLSVASPAHPQHQPTIELGTKPLDIGSDGLSVRIPIGSRAQLTQIGVQSQAQIVGSDGQWLLTVRMVLTGDRTKSPLDLVTEALTELQKANGFLDGQGRRLTYADTFQPAQNVPLGPLPGARFGLRAPSATGGDDLIFLYGVGQLAPGRFVAFDLKTTREYLNDCQAVFETVAGSLDLSNISNTEASRAAAVRAGQSWMAGITESDWQDAAQRANGTWMRLFRPGTEGQPDEELGYQRIRAWPGTKRDLDDARRALPDTSGRGADGLIVEIVARTLQRDNGELSTIDAISAFYVSDDGRDEAWTVRLGMRPPGSRRAETWKTIGARTGESMSVNIEDNRRSVRSIRPQIVGEGYLPRAHALLLPQVFAASQTPGQFGFYSYRSDAEAIVLRRDSVSPAGDASSDVLIETRLGPEAPVQRARVRESGEVAWIELAGGLRWEPIAPDRLVSLWKAQGLPIE